MSPNDKVGRIHKQEFINSILVLFGICVISASARFYIRIRVQKQLSLDDGFLLFGIGCFICALAILFTYIDDMYMTAAFLFRLKDMELSPDFIQKSFDYQKMAAVSLILTWCSIVSVKFSFLFLFRRLIDRIPVMVMYWWFVTVFNVAISGYGAVVYILACPYFYSMKATKCSQGSHVQLTFNFAMSQMVLDIVGDLLIIYIPIRLIWKIQIRLTQKIALAFSLCLTVIVIVVTVIRASGLLSGDKLDSIWETYWQFVSAVVGLILAAITAFRSFFVSRSKKKGAQASPIQCGQWYNQSRKFVKRLLSTRTWRSHPIGRSSEQNPGDSAELPQIPHGTLTGIRTFINGRGSTWISDSQMMQSRTMDNYGDIWPLSSTESNSRMISAA